MELLEYRWLFYAVVIGYSLVLPLYNHRKKLKDKLVSTKFSFSITYLLFLTLIVALCVHVGLEWKRYSNAWQENKRFNDAARYARSIGVSLDEQAEINQKRILDLEQQCEDSSVRIELETSSQARNEFASDRLEDPLERLESDIQIQKRPGFISLLPLPVKGANASPQDAHKRFKIQTDQDDRLEVVFKVLEGKEILSNYQWRKSKNPDGPFTVVELSEENENMRFSIPSGNSTLELKIYDKRSSKKPKKDEFDLLELIVNDESLLLIEVKDAYVVLESYNSVAVQVDYPREKLYTQLRDLYAFSKKGLFSKTGRLRLQMYLSNTVSHSDAEGLITETPAAADKLEPAK